MNDSVQASLIYAKWDVSDRVVAFTTTRKGGASSLGYQSFNLAEHVGDEPRAVAENRRRLCQQMDSAVDFQWLEQVHGAAVCRITEATKAPLADGLVTGQPGLACCVLTADCLPVFLAAKNGSEVGIAHAGWRGLAGDVIAATVAKMETPAKDLVAYLGPAIGPCHFEVGEDVIKAFEVACDSAAFSHCFSATRKKGKYLANLYELAALKLNSLGIAAARSNLCTVCEAESLFSYRRDVTTGRMANVIYIKP